MLLSGMIVGSLFGYAAQRGRFCIKSTFQDIQLFGDFTRVRLLLVLLLVELVGFALIAALGWISPAAKPLYWKANILGGVFFGIGMVLAGGCAGSITYRLGEGSGLALSAVSGYILASIISEVGMLNPIVKHLQLTSHIQEAGVPTLHGLLGLPYPVAALLFAGLILVAWLLVNFRGRLTQPAGLPPVEFSIPGIEEVKSWKWLHTGLVLGGAGILAFLLSPATGRNYPLGFTHGYVNLYYYLAGWRDSLAWDTLLLIGVVMGASVAAVRMREFKLRLPAARAALQSFSGGCLMGFGAILAGGCTIGHLVSGIPLLSCGSLLTSLSIISGSWLMTRILIHPKAQSTVPAHNAAS